MSAKKLTLILGIFISIAAFVWVFLKIDLVSLKDGFSQIKIIWILPMIAIYLFGFLVRGMRWRLMLKPIKNISLKSSSGLVIMGYAANNILPARLGEVVRAYVAGKKEGISRVGALSSIAIERIFDGMALVGILALATLIGNFSPESTQVIRSIGIFTALIFGVALTFVILIRFKRVWMWKFVSKVSKRFPAEISKKIESTTYSILHSFTFIKLDKSLFLVFLLSVLVWIIEGGVFVFGLMAVGLPVSFLLAYFTLSFLNLGLMAPSAPAYIGVFHGLAVLSLGFFGIDENIALIYGIIVHVTMVLPITIIGLALGNIYGTSLWRFRGNVIDKKKVEG
ncbi:MAG: flippase-like domain-containing protein [Parcubacteria group bacterium]|nr:flippase-like domain-containing protein [Parcubacteria group bacterium]